MSPDHASAGAFVTIQGGFFSQQPEPDSEDDPRACANIGSVTFGAMPGNVGMYNDHLIGAEVPNLEPGPYGVTVTVAGRRSNSADSGGTASPVSE